MCRLLLVWAWTEWVCIVAGKCLVIAWSTLHRHLHYDVPGERSLSATRVLVVCSACQVLVFVNRRLWGEPVYQLEYLLLAQLAFSVIPGWTPSCTVKHSSSTPWYSLPPLFHELIHTSSMSCFPNPFTFRPLVPSLPFVFFPFTPCRLSS